MCLTPLCFALVSSRQNAELAKLRQECTKLSKEAGEKSEALQADEQIRKNLEAKVAAAESQFSQLQVRSAELCVCVCVCVCVHMKLV